MIFNEVKGYAKRESLVAQTQQATYPQAPADDNMPPWGR